MPAIPRLALALSALTLMFASPLAAAAVTGTLLIDVGNVRNSAGTVHVDICPQARFLKEDCGFSAEAPARTGVTRIAVHGLPAGRYAVQATHDENGNGKVDRALFGIPKEGIGFSRDAPIRLSPPKWEDAVIVFDGRAGRTALRLRYFLGPSGPASH